ncbi:MAG: hypothetical protein J6S85_02760 [Methanobrevibacter sp.]|nr:hypothetical protein [Methanobrevibacter sp.]MBO7712461.1 hypothetical protein [Methanobrevibacter sp.]
MANYIDKDETFKAVREKYLACDTDTDYLRGIQQGFDFAMSIIRNQPSADVEAVVRCKDCKHHKSDDEMNFNYCKFHGIYINTDFCADGKRRKSE